MVSAALTDVPGASAVLLGAVVSYSDDVKRNVLGVETEMLRIHGAVSGETALAMAEGARRVVGSDVAVSVTGIAGPEGGTPDKPVGTVWFAVVGPWGSDVFVRRFPVDRATVRTRSTAIALEALRRGALGLPMPGGPAPPLPQG
jgi:PncC family amidohydrolase